MLSMLIDNDVSISSLVSSTAIREQLM